jgi:hypothetical protein
MSERRNHELGTWLLVLLATGCSLDTSPIAAGSPKGSSVSAPATSLADGGRASDAGRQSTTVRASDSGAPQSLQKDAGGLQRPGDASAGSSTLDSGPRSASDASAPGSLTTPAPGGQFARCTGDISCKGGLKCYNNGPGYCAQSCQADSDCTDFEGFDFTCYLPQGACRVDCSAAGTAGKCPSLLVCAADSTNNQRCLLPREHGTADKQILEPCDVAHGSGDCVAGLICFRAPPTAVDGPGYCTEPCMPGGTACQALTGMGMGMGTGMSGASFECTVGACALTCSKTCKLGMACESIGQQGYCHYPAGP